MQPGEVQAWKPAGMEPQWWSAGEAWLISELSDAETSGNNPWWEWTFTNHSKWAGIFWYPLKIQQTMENHHFEWGNSRFEWPFSIAVQEMVTVKVYVPLKWLKWESCPFSESKFITLGVYVYIYIFIHMYIIYVLYIHTCIHMYPATPPCYPSYGWCRSTTISSLIPLNLSSVQHAWSMIFGGYSTLW